MVVNNIYTKRETFICELQRRHHNEVSAKVPEVKLIRALEIVLQSCMGLDYHEWDVLHSFRLSPKGCIEELSD